MELELAQLEEGGRASPAPADAATPGAGGRGLGHGHPPGGRRGSLASAAKDFSALSSPALDIAGKAASVIRNAATKSGLLTFVALLACVYPEARPTEREAIADFCAAATAATREARPDEEARLEDLLSAEQRESLEDSFAFANDSGTGELTRLELLRCGRACPGTAMHSLSARASGTF